MIWSEIASASSDRILLPLFELGLAAAVAYTMFRAFRARARVKAGEISLNVERGEQSQHILSAACNFLGHSPLPELLSGYRFEVREAQAVVEAEVGEPAMVYEVQISHGVEVCSAILTDFPHPHDGDTCTLTTPG